MNKLKFKGKVWGHDKTITNKFLEWIGKVKQSEFLHGKQCIVEIREVRETGGESNG